MREKEPLSFRLDPELHKRLDECARRLRLKKYTLGILALEAAVEAIEKNDYRLVVPIQFEVAHVPAAADLEALASQITEAEARAIINSRPASSATSAASATLNEAAAPAGSAPLPKPGTPPPSTAPTVSYRKRTSRKRP